MTLGAYNQQQNYQLNQQQTMGMLGTYAPVITSSYSLLQNALRQESITESPKRKPRVLERLRSEISGWHGDVLGRAAA